MELRRAREASGGGLFDSLRRLLVSLLALLQTRVELFTAELSAEVSWAARLLLLAFIALFFGGLAVLMIALAVVIAVWDEHRLLAAGSFAGLFVLITLIAGLTVRSRIRARPPLLSASIDELRRDQAALREDSER